MRKWYILYLLCGLSGGPFPIAVAQQEIPQGVLCGNSVLDGGEQCDDGNAAGGDGCSADCQVEAGYTCTSPVAADLTNLIQDPGFEAGPMGGIWDEHSINFLTPICDADCDFDGVNLARSGSFWAWYGGISLVVETAYVAQDVTIPETATELRFWMRLPECNPPDDFFEVLIDEVNVFTMFSDDPTCGAAVYSERVVDISEWADGAQHTIKFFGATDSPAEEAVTSFFLDDILLLHGPAEPVPSQCSLTGGDDIFADGFEAQPGG